MSFCDSLALQTFSSAKETSILDISSFFAPSNSGFCIRTGAASSCSATCLPFGTSLDIGSLRSDPGAAECFPTPAILAPPPSDSEPEAELLSDGDRDGDFFSCFSSFFFFFFFFLAACFLCFLDFVSPSVSAQKSQS